MKDWILASEQLPDEKERVLVYVEYPVYGNGVSLRRGITIGEYDYDCGKWRCSNFIGNRVISWRRLPEPPEGV